MTLARALEGATQGTTVGGGWSRPGGPPQCFRVFRFSECEYRPDRSMSLCLIGLGSNQGNRQAILDAAVARLAAHPQINVVAASAWRETAPVGGPPGQPRFLNGALTLRTSLGPPELLALLQCVETELGRERAERWGPRTIDLDLLLYDDAVLNTPALVIPHPRMACRRFVLEPAAEVAGAMLHPTIGWTVARLLEHLNAARRYVAVTGPIAAGKTQLVERLAAALSAQAIMERPDWTRLDAFYADPAGQAWQTEWNFFINVRGSWTPRRRRGLKRHKWGLSPFPLGGERFLVRPVGGLRPSVAAGGATAGVARTVRALAAGRDAAEVDRAAGRAGGGVVGPRPPPGAVVRTTFDARATGAHSPNHRGAGQPAGAWPRAAHKRHDPDAVFAEVLAAVQGME